MPSRQDQLHSYQYSLQRVVAALVTHDPDPSRSPLRRAGMTAMVSLLIAALAVGGAAIYGLLTGHSSVNATDTKVVFQEKGSGARYVYLDSDDKLHPVLNFTSGLLLASADAPELKSISPEKLASVQLGPALGIPGAPDSLPGKDALLTDRWSICTDNKSDDKSPRSTLLVGYRLTDGVVAKREGRALLISEPNGRVSMVFNNKRYPIPPDRVAATLTALGWGDREPWPVAGAWANAVPIGPNLIGPPIDGVGEGSAAGNFKVGQVLTNGESFGLVLRDGIAGITAMQAKLMEAASAQQALNIGGELVALSKSKTKVSDANDPNGLPPAVPALHPGTPGQVCMTLPAGEKVDDGIRIDPTVPESSAMSGAKAPPGRNLADFVHVARGHGVLAAAAASPTAPAGTGAVSIITDTGFSYPLADRSLITKLGYGGEQPLAVPSALVSMLPEGPALDPQAARKAVATTG